jgi:hypothetical protein
MDKASKDRAVSAASIDKGSTSAPSDGTVKVGSGTGGGGGQTPPPNDPKPGKDKPKP